MSLPAACLISVQLLTPSASGPAEEEPDAWPERVEAALVFAGENRPEIERVLTHYSTLDANGHDPQKVEAAFFLIENMPGHGYVEYGLFDQAGNEVTWDTLEYANHGEALGAMDALEQEHGALDFKKKDLVEDLHVLTADALMRNIDLAFEAWCGNPWSRDLAFETFCEYILPHRGSNEPAEDWRGPLQAELPALLGDLPSEAVPPDVGRIAGIMGKRASSVRFQSLYYLHPTDQGFSEMDLLEAAPEPGLSAA